ncbi:LINE-1 retrotransposable element ORF1 protein, partial [Plecturocebus cupreus]
MPTDWEIPGKGATRVASATLLAGPALLGAEKAQLCGEGAPPEGKLRNRKNFITNKPDVHSETQSESRQLQRRQVDKSTKLGRNQCKKAENTRNQNASPPTGDRSSSSAREQGLTEDECDELTESGFRRWIIRNFCELKEYVLTQCKETKTVERRFNEMLTRMDNLEKSISELMELKNTTRELREACPSFNSRIDQAEERISEVEDQLNEIKREGKMTEKSVKRNEQSLQEIWDYVKRPNLHLIGVPECDEEDESKLENTLQDIIQENFPNLARQANIQVQEIQRTPRRYSSRRATPKHIIVRFTRVEMKEKMLRAAREKVRVTHKGKPIRLTADLSAETLQARREWGPTFNILKEKNFQPRISYPAKLSFISEGKIKFFVNKQVLRDYITTRPALQELLKEALHMDGNNQYQPFQKYTKSTKLAGRGGACLQFQLLRRPRQENRFNLGGGGCSEQRSHHCTTAWTIRVKLHIKRKEKKRKKTYLKSTGNKRKNRQMGFHQPKNLQHSKRQRLTKLPRLVSNSWAQVIFQLWLPKVLELLEHGRISDCMAQTEAVEPVLWEAEAGGSRGEEIETILASTDKNGEGNGLSVAEKLAYSKNLFEHEYPNTASQSDMLFKEILSWLGVVAHAYNLALGETQAGGSQGQEIKTILANM